MSLKIICVHNTMESNFMVGGSILDVTYEYVYLGVKFNYNTSFIKAIERHISRAKRAMFAIVTKK